MAALDGLLMPKPFRLRSQAGLIAAGRALATGLAKTPAEAVAEPNILVVDRDTLTRLVITAPATFSEGSSGWLALTLGHGGLSKPRARPSAAAEGARLANTETQGVQDICLKPPAGGDR